MIKSISSHFFYESNDDAQDVENEEIKCQRRYAICIIVIIIICVVILPIVLSPVSYNNDNKNNTKYNDPTNIKIINNIK